MVRSPLAILATLFDRLGHFEPAATIAGFAFSPMHAAAFPQINTTIAHLREVLGDQTYETLARKGETMTTTAMATPTTKSTRPEQNSDARDSTDGTEEMRTGH